MADTRRTVLITGCSGTGIGNSLAREFHSRGLRVIASARSKDSLSDLSALGIETLSLEVDKEESIRNARREVEQLTGGKLDYLVNNAGRNFTVPALDLDMAEVRQLFEVNLFAVMRMCQEFIPLLIAAQGTIVQLGSLAGIMPYVFGSAYNASKAALHSYSNTLRVELEPFGVKVLTLITGGVKSQIARVERELPPTSLYNPIAASYARRVTHSQEGAMPSSAYARSVVGQILGATSPGWLASVPGLGRLGAALRRCWIFGEKGRGWIWEGKMSGLVWFVDTWLPRGTMDIVFNRMFQLSRLRGTATASPGPSSSAGAKKTV